MMKKNDIDPYEYNIILIIIMIFIIYIISSLIRAYIFFQNKINNKIDYYKTLRKYNVKNMNGYFMGWTKYITSECIDFEEVYTENKILYIGKFTIIDNVIKGKGKIYNTLNSYNTKFFFRHS